MARNMEGNSASQHKALSARQIPQEPQALLCTNNVGTLTTPNRPAGQCTPHRDTHTKLRVLQSQQPAHPCRCRSCKQGRGRIHIDPTAAACCCRAARRLPSYSRHTLLLRWRRSTPAGCCRLLHLLLQTSTALLLLLRLAHVIDSQWPVPAGVVGEHLRCLRANGKEA
jgi:hypothetical protein